MWNLQLFSFHLLSNNKLLISTFIYSLFNSLLGEMKKKKKKPRLCLAAKNIDEKEEIEVIK